MFYKTTKKHNKSNKGGTQSKHIMRNQQYVEATENQLTPGEWVGSKKNETFKLPY